MSSNTTRQFQKICTLSKDSRILEGISSLLDWDQETYMPPGSANIRADQLKLLAGLIHKKRTSKPFASSLSKLIDIPSGNLKVEGLTPQMAASLREWRQDYLEAIALPNAFVSKFAQLTSQAIIVWRKARAEKKFSLFLPYLKKVVDMSRRKADYLGYQDHPYDALMNLYERDAKTKDIADLFSTLSHRLIPLIKKVKDRPIQDDFLHGSWSTEKQIDFSHVILKAMGFDFDQGRLDFSTHPFSSSSHPTDNRITTRIHPTSLMSNISAVLHEGGHALYEKNLPQEWYGNPLGDARSMGVHESQSRWWETRIGLSKPFWSYFYPLLQKEFKGPLLNVDLDAFYKAINKVHPSYIRIESDEVTYPLHVILRFEMEAGLIEGSIKVEDVPEIWNEKMERYLGIRPRDDAEGCLQDIHWSMGGFGYFPSYTMGNLYAAHFFLGFEKDHPDWAEQIAQGKLMFVHDWLKNHIHQYGRQYTTKELLKAATGKEFSAQAYLDYLEHKFHGSV